MKNTDNFINKIPDHTMLHYSFDTSRYSDLCLWEVGMEKCAPSHAFGPAVRRYYLLHIVLEGKGIFEVHKKTYSLGKGSAFLIYPDEPTYYQADAANPWTYVWISFSGTQAMAYTKAAGLSFERPIYTPLSEDSPATQYLLQLLTHQTDDVTCIGLAHLFFGQWIQHSANKMATPTENTNYIQRALIHIATSYWQPLQVHALAALCGLDRSHFCRIFKEEMGISPKAYILDFKMRHAKELLHNPALSIGDVARSVGFVDPLAFSNAFKKIMGVSPLHYRKNITASL